jgi:hypothetical protein
MELKEYMLAIYSIKDKDKNITEIQQQILLLYIKNEYLTVYQYWKQINEDQKLSYKNIHKHVQKLYSLKFLQKKGNVGKHGSVFYKLSSFGIYFLLRKEKNLNLSDAKILFEHHKNDILFETFLYHYFQKDTIVKIMKNDDRVFSYVLHYLNQCCNEIYLFLNIMKIIENSRGDPQKLFTELFRSDKRPIHFEIKELFNYDKGHIEFKLDEKSKKVFIKRGNRIITRVSIEQNPSEETSLELAKGLLKMKLNIGLPEVTKESYVNDEKDILIYNAKNHFADLCLNLIRYAYQDVQGRFPTEDNFRLFVDDKIFFKHFKTFENNMKDYFAYFQSLHDKNNSK